jgi:hypothetical protein
MIQLEGEKREKWKKIKIKIKIKIKKEPSSLPLFCYWTHPK